MTDDSRRELGDFLRTHRHRLTPDSAGVAPRRYRRTPGLRREEVAELAGIGVDWYVRLEQGRANAPSSTTISALARALQLTDSEQRHLTALASTGRREPFKPEVVSAALRRLVESLPHPAYVTGRRRDLLAWNRHADALFAFDSLPVDHRNVLLAVLTRPGARALFGPGWAAEAQRIVAQFRASYDLWAGDPAFTDLLTRLREGCPEMAGWWEQHEIVQPRSGVKTLHHLTLGTLTFHHMSFQANDDPDLKLVIYTRTSGNNES